MRPLNECRNELAHGQQYMVWLIAPWNDHQLTDGQTYRWQAPDHLRDNYELTVIQYQQWANLVDGHVRQFGGFRNHNGALFVPLEHIVVDV